MKFIKKVLFSTTFKVFLIFDLVGVGLTAIALSISRRFDLMGWTDAVTFSTAILFALIWLIFANSKGTFDMLIVGVKSFWGSFKKDYENENFFDYRQNKEKVDKGVYIGISLSFALFLIATIVLFILVKK